MKKRLLSLVILCSLNNGCQMPIKTQVSPKITADDIAAIKATIQSEITGIKAEVTGIKTTSEKNYKEIGNLVENHGLPWQVTVAAYTLAAIVVCFIIWTQLKQLGHLGCIRKEK